MGDLDPNGLTQLSHTVSNKKKNISLLFIFAFIFFNFLYFIFLIILYFFHISKCLLILFFHLSYNLSFINKKIKDTNWVSNVGHALRNFFMEVLVSKVDQSYKILIKTSIVVEYIE